MKDEPIWEETIDPSESLTIDHEIDIKPVCINLRKMVYSKHNICMRVPSTNDLRLIVLLFLLGNRT